MVILVIVLIVMIILIIVGSIFIYKSKKSKELEAKIKEKLVPEKFPTVVDTDILDNLDKHPGVCVLGGPELYNNQVFKKKGGIPMSFSPYVIDGRDTPVEEPHIGCDACSDYVARLREGDDQCQPYAADTGDQICTLRTSDITKCSEFGIE